MRKYVYIAIACLLVFAGIDCKKRKLEETHISGVFWDYCRKKPLPRFTIRLYQYKSITDQLKTTVLAEAITDENGRFDLGTVKLYDKENYLYRVKAIYNNSTDLLENGYGYESPSNTLNGGFWDLKEPGGNLYDTIRLCSQNRNPGTLKIANPAAVLPGDSLYVTSIYQYVSGGRLFSRKPCFLHQWSAMGERLDDMPFDDCGVWFRKVEKYKSGVWYIDYDTIDVKWKTDTAFVHTITW